MSAFGAAALLVVIFLMLGLFVQPPIASGGLGQFVLIASVIAAVIAIALLWLSEGLRNPSSETARAAVRVVAGILGIGIAGTMVFLMASVFTASAVDATWFVAFTFVVAGIAAFISASE